MDLVLVQTRLQVPISRLSVLTRTRLVPRQRVLLTYVVAPAGFGKSTLLAALTQGVWVRVSAHDDLGTLLHCLVAALSDRYGPIVERSRNRLFGRPHDWVRWCDLFVAELIEFGREVEIVLDDLHLAWSGEVSRFVSRLLSLAPATLTLAIASREELDLSLGALGGRAQLLKLTHRELAFTLAETDSLVRGEWKLDLTDNQLETLWKRTEGWGIALSLATQALRQHARPDQYLESLSGTQDEIFAYLSREVLRGLPEEIRKFLFVVASLDEWDLEAASAVTGQDAWECCQYLRNHPLPLEKVEGENFRFHRLFQEFLWSHCPRHLRSAVLERGAKYWVQCNMPERAGIHFERLGKLPDFLRRHGQELILRGHARRVEAWLHKVPTGERSHCAQLTLLEGCLRELAEEWSEATELFRRSIELGQIEEGWQHLCLVFLKSGRHDQLASACEIALAEADPALQCQLLAWRGASRILTGIDWNGGLHDIERSLELRREEGNFAVAVAYGFGYLVARGELQRAARFLARERQLLFAREQPLHGHWLSMNLAVIWVLAGSMKKARALVNRTMLDARAAGHKFVEEGLQAARILVALGEDNDDEIWRCIEPEQLNPQFQPWLWAGLLRHHVRRSRWSQAGHAAGHLAQMPPGLYALETNLALAEYHQARGDWESARSVLERNLEIGNQAQADYWCDRTRTALRKIGLGGRETLYLQTFGNFRLLRRGEDVTDELAGTSAKILALLVCAGRGGMSAKRLAEIVWSKNEDGPNRKTLYSAVDRLRTVLKEPHAVLMNGGIYRINFENDAFLFEDACQQARKLLQTGPDDELLESIRIAEALYQGPFWQNDDGLEKIIKRREEFGSQRRWISQIKANRFPDPLEFPLPDSL